MFASAVIERELRVRSRKQETSWLRVGVGLIGVVLALSNLNWMGPALGMGSVGKQMFLFLAWMGFAFCILEGARSAADAISCERRDGTLGLLILTRLSGFEVALGKFAAVTINSLYALLAVLPAMAIALPAGGLTAGEFWRTQIALLDTLFFAVAAGLWVSSRSQDDTRALLGTLALLTGLVVLPAVLTLPPILSLTPGMGAWPNPSPGVLLSAADALNYSVAPARFWSSLVLVQAMAWAFLILAGQRIAGGWRSERDGVKIQEDKPPTSGYTIPPSLHSDPASTDREMLEAHPARWLAYRQVSGRGLIWLALLTPLPFRLGLNLPLSRAVGVNSAATITAASLTVGLVSYFIVAYVASRRIAGERGSGALEVLLSTPLSDRDIVLGQWERLWHIVKLPWIWTTVLPCAILLVYSLNGFVGASWGFYLYQAVTPLAGAIHLLAVCWLGLWFGVWASSAGRAAGLTVVWTMLVPYLLQSLLALLFSYVPLSRFGSQVPRWIYVLIFSQLLLGVGYSLVVIFWSRHKLLTGLRRAISEPARSTGSLREFFHSRLSTAPKPSEL